MQIKKTTVTLAAVGTAVAAVPANSTVCDYYTTALLKNNTAENQYTLLTLLVNTVVIGNYTEPNVGVAVPGILAKGTYDGTEVNLLPYFDGSLASSNRGGSMGVSVNFLDGGGADPLKSNKPADDETSNQYFLLTHLYSFFGALLGCSMYGNGAFPPYMGHSSMYKVHSFMDLNAAQVGYFIEQVALSGASFGVAEDDLKAVGMALNNLFGYRCEPEMTAIPAQGPQLQSICIADDCPLAENATCNAYNATTMPSNATSSMSNTMTATMTMGSSTGSMESSTGTMTSSPSSASTAGAATAGVSIFAMVAGLGAMLL